MMPSRILQTPIEIEEVSYDIHSSDIAIDEETTWTKMSTVENVNKSNLSLIRSATISSWLVNWILLSVKVVVVVLSSSKAVLAALVDSAVDLVSQAVLSLAERYTHKYSADYPVGRSRLEALSVLTCAFIMTFASIEVIQFSIIDINNGINGNIPQLDMSYLSYSIMAGGTILKGLLYFYCRFIITTSSNKSDALEALAEDHLNDVMSNSVAIITVAIAAHVPNAWWVDPAGAILISVVIIGRWVDIMNQQVKKIVGHTAPREFICQVRKRKRRRK